jgi:hypothetical protein
MKSKGTKESTEGLRGTCKVKNVRCLYKSKFRKYFVKVLYPESTRGISWETKRKHIGALPSRHSRA